MKNLNLTLDEKLTLLTGVNVWQTAALSGKLKQIWMADGPSGVRKKTPDNKGTLKGTAMPTLSTVANSWNREIAELDGKTIADECVEKDVDLLLAPGVNIKRTPLCGRNFEYFSEDPYFSGEMGAAFTRGVQNKGIGVCLKHFAVNNRERNRCYKSNEVDERTMREIYLTAFERVLEEKPWSVMCSYNPINGVYASENKKMLNGVLREEFGFDGVVVSDWNAVLRRDKSLKATLDIAMPYEERFFGELKSAYERGFITDEEIDASVERIIKLIEKTKNTYKKVEYTAAQRHENAVKIAEEGIVLLKNEDGILPLKGGKISVNGEFAELPVIGGSGSSKVPTDYKQRPLSDEIGDRLPEATVVYNGDLPVYGPCFEHETTCLESAYESNYVIICVGDRDPVEREGYDRTSIRLQEFEERLITETAKYNKNIIVVVYAGSAIDTSTWRDSAKAIVLAGYSGEGVNEALAKILTGKISPSGKLAETFPNRIEDTPSGTGDGTPYVERYDEGLMVGYRHYDYYGIPTAYPFGHGLSYAKFEYSDLKINGNGVDYEVSLKVKNVSKTDAKEVVQLYVRDVFASVIRPLKELKGFEKVEIKAGETVEVKFTLNRRSFAFYSVAVDEWYVENGKFEIMVGASAEDIRLKDVINIELPEDEQYTNGSRRRTTIW